MTQEQGEEGRGVPLELMRELLDDNQALLRLLSVGADGHDMGSVVESRAEAAGQLPASSSVLASTYRQLLDLLEIMNATSFRSVTSTGNFDSDVSAPAPATQKNQ